MTDQPPNAGLAEDGSQWCNAPLVIGGVIVGRCEEPVWPRSRRWRKTCHAGKPHKITWGR